MCLRDVGRAGRGWEGDAVHIPEGRMDAVRVGDVGGAIGWSGDACHRA